MGRLSKYTPEFREEAVRLIASRAGRSRRPQGGSATLGQSVP